VSSDSHASPEARHAGPSPSQTPSAQVPEQQLKSSVHGASAAKHPPPPSAHVPSSQRFEQQLLFSAHASPTDVQPPVPHSPPAHASEQQSCATTQAPPSAAQAAPAPAQTRSVPPKSTHDAEQHSASAPHGCPRSKQPLESVPPCVSPVPPSVPLEPSVPEPVGDVAEPDVPALVIPSVAVSPPPASTSPSRQPTMLSNPTKQPTVVILRVESVMTVSIRRPSPRNRLTEGHGFFGVGFVEPIGPAAGT